MPTYQRSITIAAAPDELFDFLADEGASVAVTLHTEHASDHIDESIDETLQNIAELVVSRPSLQE
jgi:hypothetical protein